MPTRPLQRQFSAGGIVYKITKNKPHFLMEYQKDLLAKAHQHLTSVQPLFK